MKEITNKKTPNRKIALSYFLLLQHKAVLQSKYAVYDWQEHARPEQKLPQGDWRVWLIMAGRGFGKTRAGAEAIRSWIDSGKCRRIALISETEQDVRKVMIEGVSGILSVFPEHERPHYYSSQNKLVWPNGAEAHIFSADRYDQLRGPQFDGAWIDELGKFRYPQETWDQLSFALRLGDSPQCIITTTPRPLPLLKAFQEDEDVIVTRGSTFDNAANLSPAFIEAMKKRYVGTRLGAQELYGELLKQTDGALWQPLALENLKINDVPALQRIVIAIDPATTHHSGSDETGIVVVGLGFDKRCYVLEDLSGRYSPATWGQIAVNAYYRWKADRIVAETNKGGDLVESIVRSSDPHVSYKEVRATRGKVTRAEPVAALYEQGQVSHVMKGLEELENQLCSYIPGISSGSPDRMDALVWAITELVLEQQGLTTPKAYLL